MGRASHFAIRSRVVVLAIAANCLLCAQPAVAALHDSIRHATKALQLDADGTSVSPHTDSADFSRGAGRVHSPTHEAGTPDLTTRFYHDFWRAIEETDSAATPAVQRYHVWGNYIDKLLLHRDVAGGGNDYFAVGQHNYNVVALLDKSDGSNPIGHQGLYHDGETGLVYNRLRMLSPSLGRFMQRDPIGYPDGLNAYAAYHVMWGAVDPFGLESWWYQDLWWLVEYSVTSPNETAKMFGREVNSGYGDPVGAVQEISSALATSDHLASDFLTLADSALRRGVPQAVADGLNTGTDLWDSGVRLGEWTTGSDWSSCKAGQWSKDWLVDSSEYHREYAGNMVFEGAMGLLAANSLRSVSASARGAADEVAECADDAAVKLGKNANEAGNVGKMAAPVKGANPIQGLQRTGSALKTDPYHAFPDVVDNFASGATKTTLQNGAGLYQVEGSLNGVAGRFEWIVDKGGVTHRLFVPGGSMNGVPIKP